MKGPQSPLLPNATRELATFAAETPNRQIPPDVLQRVKLSFLDGLGVCLRGTTFPWTKMVRELVHDEGGNAIASLWGTGTKTSLSNAVLFNSTAGHAFEMDDIHKELIIHPNSLAVPVVLALAEADSSLSGGDIVGALTLCIRSRAAYWQCGHHLAFSQRVSSAGDIGRVRRCRRRGQAVAT